MLGRSNFMVALKVSALLAVVAAGLPHLGCASERTVQQSLEQRDSFRTTAAALRATGLDKRMAEEHEYVTMFAPNDAAWEASFTTEEVESLFEEARRDELRELMELHIVPGWHTLSQLATQRQARTLRGEPLAVTHAGGHVRVRDSTVVAADQASSNGVVHVLDRVLVPRAPQPIAEVLLERADTLGKFTAALEQVGLDERLREPGPYTVFVPDDAAVERLEEPSWQELTAPGNRPLLRAVLEQHIVPGQVDEAALEQEPQLTTLAGTTLRAHLTQAETLRLEHASVVVTGVEATNGLVHVLNRVLMPEALPEPETRTYEQMSVMQALGEIDEVRRFARAVELAELEEELEAQETTVLAVDDNVIDRLPEGNLLREVTEEGATGRVRGQRLEQLREALSVYLVPGTQSTAQMRAAQAVPTRHGAVLTALADGRQTRIDDVLVTRANIVCEVGMLHVLDDALEPFVSPPGTPTTNEVLRDAGVFEVLLALFEAAGMEEALSAEGPLTLLAPPDDAFAPYIGEEELEAEHIQAWVEGLERDEIRAWLQRHMLAGWVRANWLRDGQEAVAQSGERLLVDRSEPGTLRLVVRDAEAVIEESDVVGNGLVHILDSPLLPPAPEPLDDETANEFE